MFSEEFCQAAFVCIHDVENREHQFTYNNETITLVKLFGDASHKTFYRYHYRDVNYILVFIPEGLPSSEETFIPPADHLSQGAIFAETSLWLQTNMGKVPTLHTYDKQFRCFVMMDGGDLTLHDYFQQSKYEEKKLQQGYLASVDWIVALHAKTPAAPADSIMRTRVFSAEALHQECVDFVAYSPQQDSEAFSPFFTDWAAEIAAQPQVLIHRDMQSKNILLQNNSIVVIDSQDMCVGSCFYDIASLLYDPYVDVGEQRIPLLMEYFHKKMTQAGLLNQDYNATKRAIGLNAIQRLLKAAGRYQRIHQLKHNDSYLPYYDVAVPRAKALLSRVCQPETLSP